MNKELAKRWGIALLASVLLLVLGTGCKDKDEELNKQIQDQITLIDREVKEIDQHQAAMRQMVAQMQTQLNALQAELAEDQRRVKAANDVVPHLRELTTSGFGESPAHWTLGHFSASWAWVLIFLLLLFLFYRLRAKSHPQE